MKTKKETSLETMLILAGACVVLFWIYNKKIFLLVSLLLIAIGVLSPWLREKISWCWMKLSEGIGFIMSKVILSIVFFIFLLPLSLLFRIVKGDALSLKKKSGSYYSDRNLLYSKKDMENMW